MTSAYNALNDIRVILTCEKEHNKFGILTLVRDFKAVTISLFESDDKIVDFIETHKKQHFKMLFWFNEDFIKHLQSTLPNIENLFHHEIIQHYEKYTGIYINT